MHEHMHSNKTFLWDDYMSPVQYVNPQLLLIYWACFGKRTKTSNFHVWIERTIIHRKRCIFIIWLLFCCFFVPVLDVVDGDSSRSMNEFAHDSLTASKFNKSF